MIGRTTEQSTPAWPQPVRATPGSPNVLIIVLDDTGFGQLGCYGSPIATPNFDALAAGGLLYTNMHTTALCSPSRSCIITGRNHHANATAAVNEMATGYPGYHGRIPFENGFLSEMLLAHGYSTYLIGKYHLLPSEFESAVGPFDRWPLGRGFERFYGFLGGDTSQWYPDLVYDNHQVEPPGRPEEGYHLNADLADQAIGFLSDAAQTAPDKPFTCTTARGPRTPRTMCPGSGPTGTRGSSTTAGTPTASGSSPASRNSASCLRAQNCPGPTRTCRAWESLPPDERRLAARMMEVFAGFLSHTDHHLGRVLDFLKETGQFDNTLIMLVSDNGASAEGGVHGTTNELQFFNNAPETLEESLRSIDELGGPDTFNHYPVGLDLGGQHAVPPLEAGDLPGRHEDPFVVHWPAGIAARGEVRTQYAHIIDIVPTVLEALGAEPPETIRGVTQTPLQGVSFAHTFADASAPTRHETQYFEMFGHRAIDHQGWRAVCPWPGPSFAEAGQGFGVPITAADLSDLDAHHWELYHIAEDPTENHNLAETHRDQVIELIAQWYVEAGKYDVLPIDGSAAARLLVERPQIALPRDRYVYRPRTQTVPAWVSPRC